MFAQNVAADCWVQPGRSRRQVSGRTSFTDLRLVFLASGLIGTGSVSFEIALQDRIG